MSTLDMFTPDAPSPFDSIRQLREDGTEYWSARDLQPLLGYTEWRKFIDSITRATEACTAAGNHWEDHFVGAAKLSGAVTINYLRDIHDRDCVRPVPNVRTLDLTEEVTP